MPGPDITRPKSKRAANFSLLLKYAIWAGAAVALLTQPFAGRAAWNPPPPQSQSTQPGASSSPPAASTQQPSPDETGTFVIRKDVDEVLLHASVVDDKQHIVTDLDKNDFSVFEDGKPQTIVSFHHEDIPVAMGIVID